MKDKLKELLGKLEELEKFTKDKMPKTELVTFQAKADDYQVSYNDISYLHDRVNSVREMCYKVWEELERHSTVGHLPKLETPEQVEKALKALGLDKSYEVKKRVIYASNGEPSKHSWSIEQKD
jgi:hypothetical protein